MRVFACKLREREREEKKDLKDFSVFNEPFLLGHA